MTTLSYNRTTIDGDLDVGRGQLGIGWSGSTASASLWSLRRGANHYVIDPLSLSTTVTLPAVGTGSTQAQPGHWLTIANISGSNSIVVNNSSSVTISTVTPGNSVMIIADSNVASNWIQQYNTSGYGSSTLQSAYDASGTSNPQILLSNANGSVKIDDASTPLGPLFELRNNAGSYSYLTVGNTPSGAQNPSVTMIGSTTSAANTVAMIGSTVSGSGSVGMASSNVGSANTLAFGTITTTSGASGSVALCDSGSAYTGYSLPNVSYQVFRGGEHHFGGAIRPGTSKTSPNQCNFYVNANGVTTVGTTITLLGSTSTIVSSFANSTYSITLQIYGRDATAPGATSVIHELNALSVTSATNVPTLLSQRIDTSQTPGFTTVAGSATLLTTATDVTLTLIAPDNVTAPTGAGMDFRIFGSYRVLSE